MVEMKLMEQAPLTMQLQTQTVRVMDHTGEDALVSSTVTHYKNDRVKEIGMSAFQAASQLVCVDLPEVTKLGGYVFNNCPLLARVDAPKVTFVGNGAFANCAALEMIEMPSLTQLYAGAFSGCAKLKAIVLRCGAVPTLYGAAFTNTPIASGTGYIYVKDELAENYRKATNWSMYASQIRPLSALEE
jgi:hypothetical protein